MKTIYIAGPLFTAPEQDYNKRLSVALIQAGFQVDLPQEFAVGLDSYEKIYERCIRGVDATDLILAIVDGADADSGTSFEMGYARAKGKPIIAVRTDFRSSGDAGGINLMLKYGADKYVEIPMDGSIEKIVITVKDFIEGK